MPYKRIASKVANAGIHMLLKLTRNKLVKNATIEAAHVVNAVVMIKNVMDQRDAQNAHQASVEIIEDANRVAVGAQSIMIKAPKVWVKKVIR